MSIKTIENYINGEWIPSESSRTLDVINPATAEPIAKVPLSMADEANQAVEAAQEAFQEWRETPPYTRARAMFRLKEIIEDNFEEVSRTVVKEHGKIIDEARGEVRRAIENVEGAAAIPYLMMGYNLEDVATGIDEYAIRQPLGVFACIAPFNFPAMVPFWFLPYAVACGNTFVVKPSEQCPLSQRMLIEMFDEADFPPGVVNLVNGDRVAAEALLTHPDVKGVSFVGSTPVARHVYQTATAHGKRAQCQGGAKNFLVVMPDAVLDRTVAAIMTSAFGTAGQRCLAGSVVLAVGDVYEALKAKIVDSASKLTVGNGLDEGIQMGPVISAAARDRIVSYIDKGVDEGADLLLDGRGIEVDGYSNGYFVGPTVFDKTSTGMVIITDEIFGPVLSIMQVEDFEEALDALHTSPYGNAASIFTSSGKWAREFQYRATAGNIGVNIGIAAPIAAFPFSGMKESFFGDLHGQGLDGINFFTERKVVITRWF
jgi:malonate-semialdehyde dehydrogenase (acetylating)/methylmalonate-semialdehyde dehydrogenase